MESTDLQNLMTRMKARVAKMRKSKAIRLTSADFVELVDVAARLTDLNVKALNMQPGESVATIELPPWFRAMTYATLARDLGNAVNYVSFTIHLPGERMLQCIIQKMGAHTPLDQLHEAEKHLRKLVNPHSNNDLNAARAFLDRPRTTEAK